MEKLINKNNIGTINIFNKKIIVKKFKSYIVWHGM